MDNDEKFMRIALKEAEKALRKDEVPIGAVIVLEGSVIAKAHNRPVSTSDPCAHAEILVMRRAGKTIGNYRLSGAALYVTVEPCIMCAGAIVHARISRLVFGARDPKNGGVSSLYRILNDGRLNHSVEVKRGVLEEQCASILSGFFRQKRVGSKAAAKNITL